MKKKRLNLAEVLIIVVIALIVLQISVGIYFGYRQYKVDRIEIKVGKTYLFRIDDYDYIPDTQRELEVCDITPNGKWIKFYSGVRTHKWRYDDNRWVKRRNIEVLKEIESKPTWRIK